MRALIAVAVIAIGMCIVGTDDYAAAQHDAEHYCEMVADGIWPDFKERGDDC